MARMLFLSFFCFGQVFNPPIHGQAHTLTFQNAFDINDLNKIDIVLEYEDWRYELNTTNTFIHATLMINGSNAIPVKISRKGNTANNNTRARDKFPFKIDGPHSFNFKLNNNYRDYTMGAREFIGYKLHRSFTGIGSETAAAEVYINDEFYGIYLAVEDLNRKFYDDNVGGITHRIKANPSDIGLGEDGSYSDLYWLGEAVEPYLDHYEIKKGDVSDLVDLIDLINNEPDKAYKHIDVLEVVKFLAVENYLLNTDGIIGDVYSHNYELVKRKNDGKWQLVPWDLNLCLGAWSPPSAFDGTGLIEDITHLPPTAGKENNALIELIMEHFSFLYHQQYVQLLHQYPAETLIQWSGHFKSIIDKSKQVDAKLYESGLQNKAYDGNIETIDGYVTALNPTIHNRYAYLHSLGLEHTFMNRLTFVKQISDTLVIGITPDVDRRKGSPVVEYFDTNDDLKRVRAYPIRAKNKGFFAVLPNEAMSYAIYFDHNGVRYHYPQTGLIDPLKKLFDERK